MSLVKIPAVTDNADVVASTNENILSFYWNKVTGTLLGKKKSGDIVEFSNTNGAAFNGSKLFLSQTQV